MPDTHRETIPSTIKAALRRAPATCEAAGRALLLLAAAAGWLGCARTDDPSRLTISGSAVGAEAEVMRAQLERFDALHPGVRTELRVTPDAADQRHQLYVQWLNGHATDPDVLQLDIVWTAEFAAAGWILPLDRFAPDVGDFFPAAVRANRWRGALYAMPWFVDVGLLYWRTDLMDAAPRSLAELGARARDLMNNAAVPFGLVWQGARYEGLVTVFVEHLGAFGGRILDDAGRVAVDEPAAVRALTFMCDAVAADGFVPGSVLTWQEEHARLAFQNGQAAFMRNWPYAWALLQNRTESHVAGRFSVAPFPAGEGGRPTAALGGAQLAINRRTADPALAWALVDYLTAPAQMLERAQLAAQLPARASLYDTDALARILPLPAGLVQEVLEVAEPRPVTPVYAELSEILQIRLHRALSGQQSPETALRDAAREMRALLERTGLGSPEAVP
jgi:multiple sugar transport system substrate-binding protein